MSLGLRNVRRLYALWAAICVLALAPAASATTFVNDLSVASGGTETVSSTRWLAGSFTTDSSTYTSLTATLSLAQATSGAAQLKLYSDGGLVPASLLGNFTSPTTISTSLANSAFTITGVSLAANTNYWIVLQASSGSYNWGYTGDFNTMLGWADSSDSGSTWFGTDAYPLQYSVVSGVQVPGDYNGDGIIDAADYTVWRDTLGQSGSGLAADGDGDGIIGQADYDWWVLKFGSGGASGAGSGAAAAGLTGCAMATPEPSTAALLIVAAAGVFWTRHLHAQR
jgi:hypothetical protein